MHRAIDQNWSHDELCTTRQEMIQRNIISHTWCCAADWLTPALCTLLLSLSHCSDPELKVKKRFWMQSARLAKKKKANHSSEFHQLSSLASVFTFAFIYGFIHSHCQSYSKAIPGATSIFDVYIHSNCV